MKIILRLILPALLLGLALLGYKKLSASRPAPKNKPQREVITEAEIIQVSPKVHEPQIESFGIVRAHFESTLTPQISGLIVGLSPEFQVGKLIKEGTSLIKIDERSYRSLLIQQEANLAAAELAYAEEKILAEQAITDWRESGRDLSKASDFVLRKPQLKSAKAQIESMKASVRKATADLGRTQIFAPFDAIVTSRTASLGNLANEQQAIGTVVATERVEVVLPLTPEQAARVDLSLVSPVTVTLSSPTRPEGHWTGTVARVEPMVGESQTTDIIVEVRDPFQSGFPHLSIGLFVNAKISGKPLAPSLRIPESALVNDSYLWALNEFDQLLQLPARRLSAESGDLFVEVSKPDSSSPFRIVSRPLVTFEVDQKVKATKGPGSSKP